LEPVLSAVSSSEVQIDWNIPLSPNGIIISYTIYRITVGGGEMLVASLSEVGSYTVGGLEPFTEYVFLVEACTSVGCNRSDVNSIVTLESGESLVHVQ
jgi:usherin